MAGSAASQLDVLLDVQERVQMSRQEEELSQVGKTAARSRLVGSSG